MAAFEIYPGCYFDFIRYFRSSSLPALCKKAHMLESLFNKIADLYPEILLETASWIFFNEFCKILILRTPSLQDTSKRLLLIYRKRDIQTFNSKQICSLDQYSLHNIFEE